MSPVNQTSKPRVLISQHEIRTPKLLEILKEKHIVLIDATSLHSICYKMLTKHKQTACFVNTENTVTWVNNN